MVGREAFLMKPKHQCHLSKWGECAYDLQPWRESWLLHESETTKLTNELWIKKMVGREAFLIKPKH